MAKEREPFRRILIANPREPRAGEDSYTLYDQTHPKNGTDARKIQEFRSELRGLRGQNVTVIVNGSRQTEDGEHHRFRSQRTVRYNEYSDIFGPASAYYSAMKAVRNRHSPDKFLTYSIIVQPATGEDDDDELE